MKNEPKKITIRLYDQKKTDDLDKIIRSDYRDKLNKIVKYKRKFETRASVNNELLKLLDNYIEKWENMNLFKSYKMRNDKTLEELEYLSKKANRWGFFITSISLIFFLILLVNILNNNFFINYPPISPILIFGLALILMSPLSLAIPFLWLMEGFHLIIIEKKNINIEVERIKDNENEDNETKQEKLHRNKNKLQIWFHTVSLERLWKARQRGLLISSILFIIISFGIYYFLSTENFSESYYTIPFTIAFISLLILLFLTETLEFHYHDRINIQKVHQHAIEIIENE